MLLRSRLLCEFHFVSFQEVFAPANGGWMDTAWRFFILQPRLATYFYFKVNNDMQY